jgi:hypothetical protein
MTLLNIMVADYAERFGHRLSLPEYRQIEIYARKKRVSFGEDGKSASPATQGLLGFNSLFMLLDGFCERQDPSLEGMPLWQRYRALPRKNITDKLVAELYRILRIIRLASLHETGQIEIEEGLINLFCIYNRDVLRLSITPLGLELIRSSVVYYLNSFEQPYSDAYVEAMLMEYFADIVNEIKNYADEDRALFQFRRKVHFSRTLRLDCDSPRFTLDGGRIHFEIGAALANAARYPIDIFVVIGDVLHIIPIEALTDFSLPLEDLPQWKSRSGEMALPAHFRLRFGRVIQVAGQPMS